MEGAAGEKQEKTEWHRVVLWNNKGSKLADIAEQYCKKGDKVYVEGSIEYRSWQDREGQTRYTTEITARELIMLSGKGDGGSRTPRRRRRERRPPPNRRQGRVVRGLSGGSRRRGRRSPVLACRSCARWGSLPRRLRQDVPPKTHTVKQGRYALGYRADLSGRSIPLAPDLPDEHRRRGRSALDLSRRGASARCRGRNQPAVPTTDTPPPAGITVVGRESRRPTPTGDGLDLFRRRRVANVAGSLQAYRDVKYHPLRAGRILFRRLPDRGRYPPVRPAARSRHARADRERPHPRGGPAPYTVVGVSAPDGAQLRRGRLAGERHPARGSGRLWADRHSDRDDPHHRAERRPVGR